MKHFFLRMVRFTKTKSAFFSLLAFFIFIGFFGWMGIAFAQGTALTAVGEASGLATEDIGIVIARIIRIFISVLGIVAVILILYSGWLYMVSKGEPAKTKKALDILKNAFIGFVIILASYSITTFILNRLLEAAGYGAGITSVLDQYIEPLSGSLGGGIIDDHYPERNATDIPRNTRIMITFKEPMDPASFIQGYDPENPTGATGLTATNVSIYPTDAGVTAALTETQVSVAISESAQIVVFDPVELLGSPLEDTNYTIVLKTTIEKADGTLAFSGRYSDGYEWTFEVSTEVDLTPPQVVSVIPVESTTPYDRNITIEMTFNEAMDPVAATGVYSIELGDYFSNIEISDSVPSLVEGTYEISNGYRTVGFTTFDACGEDPCGDTIYCLPPLETIVVEAHAASVGDDAPQAVPRGTEYDGLIDVCGNSLDGDGDGQAAGSDTDGVSLVGEITTITNDDYSWEFDTTDNVNDTVPEITLIDPGISEGDVIQQQPVTISFNTTMKSSTLNSEALSLWPDPLYEMWFSLRNEVSTDKTYSLITMNHPTFVSQTDGGWDYYPVIENGVKSSWQICMYPAYGPSASSSTIIGCTSLEDDGRIASGEVYCCDGERQSTPCVTDGETETSTSGFVLPVP